MRHLVFLLPFLLAATPSPTFPIIEYKTTQSLTQALPTVSTDGMSLSASLAYRVSICAASGTLSGTGNLRAYVYVPSQGQWMNNPDQDVAVTSTGPCELFSDRPSSIHKGQLKYVADSVGTSGASTVTVLIEAVVQ